MSKAIVVPKNLNTKEAEAYEKWLLKDNSKPVPPLVNAQMLELYLNGSDCEDIQKLNPTYPLGAIVEAKVMGKWDVIKTEYIDNLMVKVRERVQQVTFESIEFVANTISAANKLHGDKIKKFMQTGDITDLKELGVSLSSIKTYKEIVELLLKMTGQDSSKVQGEVLHKHMVQAGNEPTPAKKALSAEKAAELLKILEGDVNG